ncbi:MAG: VacJ family lipoprotein, partial [Methylobacter sp.]
ALDPYVFTREAFLQWRNNLAADGKAEASTDMDDFEAELDENVNAPAAKAPATKKEATNAADTNNKADIKKANHSSIARSSDDTASKIAAPLKVNK